MKDFKENVFKLFAAGSENRDPSLPENVRSYDRPAKLWERFGEFIGERFVGSIDFNTDENVPSLVFRLERIKTTHVVTLLDVLVETEGISLKDANGKYEKPRNFGVIGYDTEFVSKTQKLLSHQFCFDIGVGIRFGVVLDTDIRFTDITLLKFLEAIVVKLEGCRLNKWYLFAHFSLAEGSWVDSGEKKLIEREQKEWKGKLVLTKRTKLTGGGKPSMTKDKKTNKTVEKLETVWLYFADTMNLDPRSLKDSAESCGLHKYSVLDEKYKDRLWFKKGRELIYRTIDKLRDHNPLRFYRYGVIDAIITAGIPIVLHSKFGVDEDFQVRTAKYSEKHMFKWFQSNFGGVHQGWQHILGQRKIFIPATEEGKKPYERWEPDKLQQLILHDWYKGGRNEARRIGCFSEPVSYFDMTSAYPTALAALVSDFDFGSPIVRTRNDGAVQRIDQLYDKGPFQPHGVKLYVRFKDDCKVPMAPISTEAGIIYPLENEGQIVCWPEYWTAKKLGIIKEEFIFAFYEFTALETRKLPDYILEMIKLRQTDKIFYKSILNYLSGKFAQGKKENIPYSSISCPALAAYLTSTTRAAAAEIGNLNEYYAITTDGIICPKAASEELVLGEINKRLEERLKPTGFKWLKNEFTGDKTVIIKTRGYILVDSKIDPILEPEKTRFKQARMGLQGEVPLDILKQIKVGKGVRSSAKTFAKLDDGEIFSFIEKEFNVNPNFDFKYSIIGDTIVDGTIEVDGLELTMPCFKTKPLRNINEHYDLRRISDWKAIKNLSKLKEKRFSGQDIHELILTSLLNDRRCRHMVWEFRKRMVRKVDVKETNLHVNTYNAWKKKPVYDIPAEYGSVEAFRPILEKEVLAILDEAKRGVVLQETMEWMEVSQKNVKGQEKVVTVVAERNIDTA